MQKKEYFEKYYEDHKEHLKKYSKQYKINNPEYYRRKKKQYDKEYPEQYRIRRKRYEQSLKGRFVIYKTNAKRRGFIFKITFDEFAKIMNEPCHYCGGEGYGIDRLDSSIGYLKDNIVPCCSMCNYMKRAYTKEDFINQCIKISNNH